MNYPMSTPYSAIQAVGGGPRYKWRMHAAPIRGKIRVVSQNQDLQKDIDETLFFSFQPS